MGWGEACAVFKSMGQRGIQGKGEKRKCSGGRRKVIKVLAAVYCSLAICDVPSYVISGIRRMAVSEG